MNTTHCTCMMFLCGLDFASYCVVDWVVIIVERLDSSAEKEHLGYQEVVGSIPAPAKKTLQFSASYCRHWANILYMCWSECQGKGLLLLLSGILNLSRWILILHTMYMCWCNILIMKLNNLFFGACLIFHFRLHSVPR